MSKLREGGNNGVPHSAIPIIAFPKFGGAENLLYLCSNHKPMFENHRITHDKLDLVLEALTIQAHITHSKLDHIMATLAQLTAAIGSINTALAAVGTEIASLNTTITNSIAGTDSDTLLTELNTIAQGLEALVPAAPTPAV